jgi:DNA polymerase III delta prime subunit
MVDQYATAPAQGWPRWMEREIQSAEFVLLVCTETYLRRVEGREQPGKGRGVVWEVNLIYNLLYPEDAQVQKFIPIILDGGQPSSIPFPLRGVNHYKVDTDEGYDDLYRHLTGQPHQAIPNIGNRRALPAKEPQSFPSSSATKVDPKHSSSLEQRHRQQMIKQVRLDWIQGVLDQSLYKVARLELGLANRSDAIEQPLNAVVQVPDRLPTPIPRGTSIGQVFDEQAGALLILGAPGTGKTTLLLELARDLLDRAELDESQPVPVVFNLSSWAARRQPLSEWLIAELNERSYVPEKVAWQWVEDEQIVPLLDGLDEVAALHREACVDSINEFRREHGLLHIAVCSRIADCKALGSKLRLRSAVEVQPLTKAQVEDYLARVGDQLRGLRAAVQDDPVFWGLLETPLMLWVAMLAYKDQPRVSVYEERLERRHNLFAQFVEAMFTRKAGRWRCSAQQTTLWLSFLARTLTAKSQTVFYLENLDFDWVQSWKRRGLALGVTLTLNTLVGGCAGGLTFVLATALAYGFLKYNLFYGLTTGLIGGFMGGLIDTLVGSRPIEKLSFKWTDISFYIKEASREGLNGFATWAISVTVLWATPYVLFEKNSLLRH